MLQNYFGCVLRGVKLGASWTLHPPENVKHMMARIHHQYLDMFKPALQLGTGPDQWVTASFWSSVPDCLSKTLWLRAPGASLNPCQLKICCLCQNFASAELNNLFLLSSWHILLQLLWNLYPWKQFFHWLHGLSLFLTTRNVKRVLFLQ